MSFQSLSFLAFLAVTVPLCCLAGRRHRRWGQWLLTLACLVFYAAGGRWQGLLALAAGLAVTAAALRGMEKAPARRRALVLGCGWHIAVLLVFKYTGFFTGGAVSIGWAPLGLSFFTFQQLWLLKEAYTGQYQPVQGDDLTLYALFFPTVTSGPILRPGAFFPQLREGHFLRPDWQDISAGLYAFSLGLAKKTLLADSFGTVVANGWAMGEDMTAPAAWMVMLGYTLQLYFDFSGYCDMATGAARLLGVRLPLNFDSPYRSLSVGEFWKRWHITLTTFLRECLYFPLGGSKKGTARTYLNILIVFLVSGFWHGAGWTFLVWGALHGLAQVAERAWGPARDRLPKGLRWAMTFVFVSFAWVFFQAPSLTGAVGLLSAAVTGGPGLPLEALAAGMFDSEVTAVSTLLPALAKAMPGLTLAGLFAVGMVIILWPRNVVRQMDTFRPTLVRAVACGILTVWSVLSFSGVTTFIYSNF